METIKEEKAASGENQKKPAFAVKGNSALKTTIAVGLAAAIIGGVIGYSVKPVAKTQDLVVTEDVSAVIAENNGTAAAGVAASETPGKTYTQITDILDNARHVVEERFYASEASEARSWLARTAMPSCARTTMITGTWSPRPTLTLLISPSL